MTNELEPCPFCPGGGDPNHFGGAGHHCVKCSKCGRTNERLVWTESDGWHYEAFDTSEEAADDWNTRYKKSCKYKQPDPVNTPGVWNTECGHHVYWNVDNKDCGTPPKHCPKCGAEVMDE